MNAATNITPAELAANHGDRDLAAVSEAASPRCSGSSTRTDRPAPVNRASARSRLCCSSARRATRLVERRLASLHSLHRQSGTGKTTVAMRIADILHRLGYTAAII
jgi:hypothetical protein